MTILDMFLPPKVTNGAQILNPQVVLHKNQPPNLLWPPRPCRFLIFYLLAKWLPNIAGEHAAGFWLQSAVIRFDAFPRTCLSGALR